MNGMARALRAMGNAADSDVPLTIYYAYKQSEGATDGITSPGWASFLQAVVDSGLAVDGTWPLRTELGNRMMGWLPTPLLPQSFWSAESAAPLHHRRTRSIRSHVFVVNCRTVLQKFVLPE